jgi:hypothetical protein
LEAETEREVVDMALLLDRVPSAKARAVAIAATDNGSV